MINIDYVCGTHAGLVREVNEDAYFADPELGLWVLADGMGGHMAGEVASGIVVQELPLSIRQGDSIAEAIDMAHLMIQVEASQNASASQMGSTVVVLKLADKRFKIAWVGDSRAYLWSNKQLQRLTKDHSYVQELLDRGMLLENEVFTHPSRNLICQALGLGGTDGQMLKPGEVGGELALGETLLLCSDGLCGVVRDAEIADIMNAQPNNQTRLEQLIGAALKKGGLDNITVILVTAAPAE
jgi:protein phosphatase